MGISKHLSGLFRLARGSVGLAAVPCARKDGLRELLEQQGRILDMIAMENQLKPILQELAELIERQVDARCAIFFPDGEAGADKLRLVVTSGMPREYVRRLQGLEITPSMGASGAAVYERRLIVVADAGDDPRCRHYRDLLMEHPQLKSCWAAPVLAPDRSTAAVFELHRERHVPPTAEALAVLEMAGRLLKLAIEQSQLREELHRRIYYDEITGLPNRSFFRERLEQALRQEEGGPRPFAVLYIKIEGLQAVHERLGQVAEDDWLKQTADLLYCGLSGTGAAVLCRMAEGRFAALVWDATEAEATMLGRSLAAVIESTPFNLDPSCRLAAAVGIGVYPKHGEGVFQAAKASLNRARDPKF